MNRFLSLMLLLLFPFGMKAQSLDNSKVTITVAQGNVIDTLLLHIADVQTPTLSAKKLDKKRAVNERFEVCSDDGVWHKANVIYGDNGDIKVYSDEVQHPKQIRYDWDETMLAGIMSSYGLTTLPFAMPVAQKHKPTIFSIGDSTMANKGEGTEECGWGQVLNEHLTDAIIVDNHAQNGRSSKSFIDEGRWQKVLDKLQPGDYVFIQFGHNDEKADEKRHTDANTSFKDNLRKFITEAEDKGAQPVLFNSMVRRKFGDDGKLINTHGEYIKAPFEVAEEMGVPYVDAESISKQLVESMGPVESKKLYMWFPPKKQDDTHLNHTGARKMSKLFLDAAVEVVPSLKKYLK